MLERAVTVSAAASTAPPFHRHAVAPPPAAVRSAGGDGARPFCPLPLLLNPQPVTVSCRWSGGGVRLDRGGQTGSPGVSAREGFIPPRRRVFPRVRVRNNSSGRSARACAVGGGDAGGVICGRRCGSRRAWLPWSAVGAPRVVCVSAVSTTSPRGCLHPFTACWTGGSGGHAAGPSARSLLRGSFPSPSHPPP